MKTKKIYDLKSDKEFTMEELANMGYTVGHHIDNYKETISKKDYERIYNNEVLQDLFVAALLEGAVTLDIDEVKRRTTPQDIVAIIDEIYEIARLSSTYKNNKAKYVKDIEIE